MKSKDLHEETAFRRVSAGIREEEVCQILNLKNNLDYSEVLVQYSTKYLRLGWDLLAVNFKGEPALDLDFSLNQKLWADKLARLGLEGIQVNLGVRTGAPSRLLVLEVHRAESLSPFNQRGEWCSGCVAEVGLEREQHYYTLPKGWQPPSSFFLESCQIMVFGEGGVVLAPPSLEPRAQSNLRWLRPPWESPPPRPSAGLCRFIREHAPVMPQAAPKSEPASPPWSEIYPVISQHPQVLQALLEPAPSPERYYQRLLQTAKAADLEDSRILFGLLWHAPLGNSHSHPQRAQYLEGLIKQTLAGLDDIQPWEAESAPLRQTRESSSQADTRVNPTSAPGLKQDSPADLDFDFDLPFPAPASEKMEPASNQPANGQGSRQPGWQDIYEAWSQMCRFSHENLVVERRRYETMIYELGKLGALSDFFKRECRQNKALRDKLESQWTKELDHLRQLVGQKTKKGWYRSWRQQ
ncbi:MAG: bifunctional DNA primase/polymerase [Deltaproteobacteria bacterium]|nr:bifunctional DNA primase/polymerase [Deltaproteobacteria bacterium]